VADRNGDPNCKHEWLTIEIRGGEMRKVCHKCGRVEHKETK